MKISEMNNEQASEAMIRLSVSLGNICDDEDATAIFKEIDSLGNVPLVQAIGRVLPKVIMFSMKKHRDDLFEIIGALTDQPASKASKMNFKDTIKIVKDSYDDILADFFTSSVPVTATPEKA